MLDADARVRAQSRCRKYRYYYERDNNHNIFVKWIESCWVNVGDVSASATRTRRSAARWRSVCSARDFPTTSPRPSAAAAAAAASHQRPGRSSSTTQARTDLRHPALTVSSLLHVVICHLRAGEIHFETHRASRLRREL